MKQISKRLASFSGILIVATALTLLASCSSPPTTHPTPPVSTTPATTPSASTPTAPATTPPVSTTTTSAVPKPVNPELILSSTTSVRDTGLMDVLLPMFEAQTGYKVKPIYNGTGQALALAQQGGADVVVVHSPNLELPFMAAGFGINRTLIAHNDFIILGPPSDPAKIAGMTSSAEAFKKIAAARAAFYSRGDGSGTDTKEKSIWKSATVNQTGQPWYFEANLGMGDLLRVTSEKQAYTLSDRATYLANNSTLSLDIMVENDLPLLLNIYHVIQVNPGKFSGTNIKINHDGARAFLEFLTDPKTQGVIGKFGVDKYGQQLFVPDAGKTETSLGSF
ncbi:MAG: substrate-binding domain-containing protein [Chloroflexi bacterium]|nr:substrate-binding domain-containing protein [Chloroflexota bacterium]